VLKGSMPGSTIGLDGFSTEECQASSLNKSAVYDAALLAERINFDVLTLLCAIDDAHMGHSPPLSRIIDTHPFERPAIGER